jgi:hypothetical protein
MEKPYGLFDLKDFQTNFVGFLPIGIFPIKHV